jgi:phytoene dehydrogenase-like protein
MEHFVQNSYDAVIIGAGHNSLACAAHLAAKGWSVAVFEQAAIPGGAVKTGEFSAPGFRHDWGAMNLSLFAGSPFFRQYGPELQENGLELAPVENCFASVFPDGSWLGVSTDMAVTAKRIEAFSARDAETWKDLVGNFPAEAEHLFGLLNMPMKKYAFASFFIKLLRKKGFSGSANLGRFLMSSPRTWLTETFESNQVRAMLAAWGMHLDFAPDIAGGALFPYLEAMANQSFGMVLGKGGADTMIRALTAMIEKKGGVIECGARVERVIHRDGQALGIVLADGREITARRAVIANVAPGALVDKLLSGQSGDTGYDRKMRAFSHAPGTMMLHLAMDALPGWSASEDLARFAYVHLAPSMDQMARTYAQAKAGLLPAEPVIVVGQPTAVDPSRAPEGKHVLWLQVRMAPATITGDAKGEIAACDWAEAAEPMAERALDILDRYAPGVRSNIIARRIVTPLELETDNPNLVGGDQVCGSHHLSQHFLFRPALGRASGATPIKNLHLIGAGVWPGAGVGAGSGYHLGHKLAGA